MNLYEKLSTKPKYFQRLTGLSLPQFQKIVRKLYPIWQRKVLKKKQLSGRPYALGTLENQLLALMVYYRSYASYVFLGYFFRVDASTMCRHIKRLEPLLRKSIALKKRRKIDQKEVENILLDCTEQPIQRPTYNQKRYYSGKKKQHTIKTEIQITQAGRILAISDPQPGSVHDFKIHRLQKQWPSTTEMLADSGYQGLQKLSNAKIPIKGRKLKPLTQEGKSHNKALSRVRVKVEHKIRAIKTYGIIGNKYRNRIPDYAVKMRIIAGLVNLKGGF